MIFSKSYHIQKMIRAYPSTKDLLFHIIRRSIHHKVDRRCNISDVYIVSCSRTPLGSFQGMYTAKQRISNYNEHIRTRIISNKIVPIYTFLVLFLLHLGSLKEIPAPKLGALAIKDSLSKINLPLDAVEEVLMGCVVQVSMNIRITHGFNMSFT